MYKKQKPRIGCDAGPSYGLPDSDLLSHRLRHYHRRTGVSRSCSGWEGVGPPCYGRQALNFRGTPRSPTIRSQSSQASLHCLLITSWQRPPWPTRAMGTSRTGD